MNRTIRLIFSYSALVAFLASCSSFSSSSTQSNSGHSRSENAVATIGDQSIYLEDLIHYYERNNLETEYTSDDLKEFLPYYVDFKLKLAYGEQNGMLENPDLLSEYENYAKQAAYAYWLENDIKKQLLDEFSERSKYELKSHHILIRLDERSRPAQEEQARNQIHEAREKFLNNEMTIEELDSVYSTQIQGRSAGGELPWFSAGVTVKPFEDALFELEPGEISEPVRTQFGYHLIYLVDKRERIPDRQTSHIFFRGSRGDLSAEQLSQQAYDSLEAGQSWDVVAQQFSQDGSSSSSGGRIGWVGFGRQYSNEFIEAVIETDSSLPYSEPVQTNYGYHIFKIDSVRTYKDDEHRRAELAEQFEELPRNTADREQVLQRLSEIGGLQVNNETATKLENFFASSDTSSVEDLSPGNTLESATLITFDGDQYTAERFLEWLAETDPSTKASDYSEEWIDRYKDYILDSYLIELTRREFADFDKEIEGFLSGLVVFQVSDDNIWNSETADSAALKAYYEEHLDQYQYGERYDYTIIASRSDSTLNVALDKIHSGENPLDFSDMDDLFVSRDSVASPAEEIQTALDNIEAGQISEEFMYRNQSAHVIFNQMLEPRTMTFEEAFHRVNSDYQPVREEKFMSRLREEFNVQTYPERIQLN